MVDGTIAYCRILDKLGAGGMGVVSKALDTRLDGLVAVKFLPDHMEQDAQALERFRREAHAASALNHSGICTIYDVGEQDHHSLITMEFIDGETLSQYIHRQSLAVEQVLNSANARAFPTREKNSTKNCALMHWRVCPRVSVSESNADTRMGLP